MAGLSRADRPPLHAFLSLLVRSLRIRRRSWIVLLAGFLALVVYGRTGSNKAGEGIREAGELDRRSVRWDRERDEDEVGVVFPPLPRLQDRDRLWPPDLSAFSSPGRPGASLFEEAVASSPRLTWRRSQANPSARPRFTYVTFSWDEVNSPH
jgi:hypothetical protein